METTTASNAIIKSGEINGISITHDLENGRYLLTMPNKYDLYYPFYRKLEKVGLVDNPAAPDKAKNIIFATPSVFDMDDKAQKQLMIDVNHARNVNSEIMGEREIFTTALDFDLSPKKLYYKGIPLVNKKDEQGNKIQDSKGQDLKTPGFIKGELVAVGKYLVAIKSHFNETDSKAEIHMIETSKLLTLEDYKQHDRFDAVCKKLGIDSEKDFNLGNINKGISKYIDFNEKGMVNKVNHTYTKQVKQEEKIEEKPIPVKAKQLQPSRSVNR